jgi:hypothetical protein
MSTVVADLILVVHFAFVIFVVAGLPAIWIGAALQWNWVRSYWFRVAHLGAISFVAAEALAGMVCPLTLWEDALRGRETEQGFIARWIHAAMFFTWPPWVFTLAYVSFAALVALTYWYIPPVRRAR